MLANAGAEYLSYLGYYLYIYILFETKNTIENNFMKNRSFYIRTNETNRSVMKKKKKCHRINGGWADLMEDLALVYE